MRMEIFKVKIEISKLRIFRVLRLPSYTGRFHNKLKNQKIKK